MVKQFHFLGMKSAHTYTSWKYVLSKQKFKLNVTRILIKYLLPLYLLEWYELSKICSVIWLRLAENLIAEKLQKHFQLAYTLLWRLCNKQTIVTTKYLWHRSFLVNFAKFLRTHFLRNTSRWLLLKKATWIMSP